MDVYPRSQVSIDYGPFFRLPRAHVDILAALEYDGRAPQVVDSGRD